MKLIPHVLELYCVFSWKAVAAQSGCCMVFYGVRICLDTDCPMSLSTIQTPRICEKPWATECSSFVAPNKDTQ